MTANMKIHRRFLHLLWVIRFSLWLVISGLLIASGTTAFGDESSAPASPVSLSRSTKASLRSEKGVVFQVIDGQQVLADVYRPDSNEILPAIIMIHGGAWISGDKWNVIDHAIQMAQSGFVVMAINYRLAPAFPWPAQLVDCQAALGWMEKHAEEWQADIERLGVWGYSAGGHLALMMALEQKTELPRIRACVAGGPPCNLDYIPLKSQMLAAFLGGSREKFPDRYRDASPIYLLSPDDPPLFVFHGDQDSIVPIENSRQMLNKIVDLGITHEYRAVPNLGHLMTFLDRKSRLDAIEFLKKHLVPTSP